MTNVQLSGLNTDTIPFECPIGTEILLTPPPTSSTKLFNIAEHLLKDSNYNISYSEYTSIRSIKPEDVIHESWYSEEQLGFPDYLLAKEPDKLAKGEDHEFEMFSKVVKRLNEQESICDETGTMHIIKLFQYELLEKPLSNYFRELINELHDTQVEFVKFAENITKESYRLYQTYESQLDELPATHQVKCISKLNALIKDLLPECPRRVYGGHFYASEVIYLNEDDTPPFDIFSKEIEELTEQEEEMHLLFKFILAVLENRNDTCDKVGILYLVKVFQYELFGHQLSLYFKGLLTRQRKKNLAVFKLAENIVQQSYHQYLGSIRVKNLDDITSSVCFLEPEHDSDSELTPEDKLTDIAISLLPSCSADYIDELRPLYFSELLALDDDPPFHLFSMDLEELLDVTTERPRKEHEKALRTLGAFFSGAGDVQDLCDRRGLLYFVKILHYVLLGKSLGSAFKYLEFCFDEEEKPDDDFSTLAINIAHQSYEIFKLQESV